MFKNTALNVFIKNTISLFYFDYFYQFWDQISRGLTFKSNTQLIP